MSENQLENQLQVKKIRILTIFPNFGILVQFLGWILKNKLPWKTPETIVEAALQEDVDAIGISILSGAHMTIFPKVKKLMDDKGLNDVLLFGGGIIPDADIEELKKLGIGQLFTPGTPTFDTINYVKKWVLENKERENL